MLQFNTRSKGTIDDMFEQFMELPDDGREKAQIIYDLRAKNKGNTNESFEIFYTELDAMLEEFGKAAEERRASMAAHLPFAVSVPDMIRKVSLYTVVNTMDTSSIKNLKI